MKKLLIVVAVLAGCATAVDERAPVRVAGLGVGPTQEEITNAGGNTDNVVTYGLGYNHNRYSPLRQINKGNVKRLVPVWNVSLQNDLGEQAQPLIYNGVMFVSNARWTVRDRRADRQGDLAHAGQLRSRHAARGVLRRLEQRAQRSSRARSSARTLDAHVVALDMKTGKEIWKQKVAEWKEGYSMTVAPLVANGVLITGMLRRGVRRACFLDGWDPETGKKLWRRYTIAGPGEPGHDTWPAGEAYLRGGG